MEVERIPMKDTERERLVVLRSVAARLRTQVEGAQVLELSTRQVRRLLRALEAEGDGGVIHKLRGRVSNRACLAALRERVIALYRTTMPDYGPTLASERLAEAHGLHVPRETLRRWLLAEGLWKKVRSREIPRMRRPRRACAGELLQADGSVHDWLEGRGPRCTLIAMIDDASSRIMARFHEAETTEAYFDVFGRYLRAYGLPIALYTDRSGIFRTERKKRETDPEKEPQFARALGELRVRRILAYSPQAKGRVERLFGTLQDRLTKALREANACSIPQANELLETTFLKKFNAKFAVKPASEQDAHRPCPPASVLASALCVHAERFVANDYTVRYDNKTYQLLQPMPPGLRGRTITVQLRQNGEVVLCAGEKKLNWRPAAAAAPSRPRQPDRTAAPEADISNELRTGHF